MRPGVFFLVGNVVKAAALFPPLTIEGLSTKPMLWNCLVFDYKRGVGKGSAHSHTEEEKALEPTKRYLLVYVMSLEGRDHLFNFSFVFYLRNGRIWLGRRVLSSRRR